MTIDIICPLYNAEKYIENQYNQIKNQSFYNNIKNINCTIFRRNIYNEFIKEEVDDNQLEKIITINSLNISKNQRFLMLSNIIIYFIGYLLFQILFEVIFNSGVIIRGVSIGS